MKFRPCIDIHNGKVKQIVGGSLIDEGDQARENYSSPMDADYYANMYRKDGLSGGHVILLNPPVSEYYEDTLRQAEKALSAYPKGLQIGGGIRAENAERFLNAGASHVIVTSYVFQGGQIRWDNLDKLKRTVGKDHIVVDLSCRRKDGDYYIVTDRWQTFTEVKLCKDILCKIAGYCDEFLIHGVDVEGKASGIDEKLAKLLGEYEGIPVTYAGGIASLNDLEKFRNVTGGKIDFTVGSALDIFGGKLPYNMIKCYA
ncbi:MAG: phosphoribosylformimino-5-aminoimidazole carboxamide ribotide isomerase [Lachnospiraceae bacterium]